MIYEGTNGIQALDLVGRKLALHGGRAYLTFIKLVSTFAEELGEGEMLWYKERLLSAISDLNSATEWLRTHGQQDPDNAGAAAVPYLKLFALVAMAYVWAKIALRCDLSLEGSSKFDPSFYQNKKITASYFFSHVLIETTTLKQRVEAGASSIMALRNEAFLG